MVTGRFFFWMCNVQRSISIGIELSLILGDIELCPVFHIVKRMNCVLPLLNLIYRSVCRDGRSLDIVICCKLSLCQRVQNRIQIILGIIGC